MPLRDLPIIERRIITRFLDDLAALNSQQPVTVMVKGEGETDYRGPFVRASIEEHIGNCDDTTVVIVCGAARGNVLFMHGLHDEVIANMGGNTEGYDMMDRLLKAASLIADEVL